MTILLYLNPETSAILKVFPFLFLIGFGFFLCFSLMHTFLFFCVYVDVSRVHVISICRVAIFTYRPLIPLLYHNTLTPPPTTVE